MRMNGWVPSTRISEPRLTALCAHESISAALRQMKSSGIGTALTTLGSVNIPLWELPELHDAAITDSIMISARDIWWHLQRLEIDQQRSLTGIRIANEETRLHGRSCSDHTPQKETLSRWLPVREQNGW